VDVVANGREEREMEKEATEDKFHANTIDSQSDVW